MIEALVTSVDYADYLAETLPFLVRAADSVLVVTTPGDVGTRSVVEHVGCGLHATEAFYRKGAPFNKGAAIQEALGKLSQADWVLHTDADIAITDRLETEGLDPRCLYFAPRARVRGRAVWEEVKQGVSLAGEYRGGMGYFQLWNARVCPRVYPASHHTAAKTDLWFNDLWPENQQRTLTQVVYHLEMPNQKPNVNWKGRRSERFT